ncbi:MAG: PAS domain S-box protein [Bacteroidales bacterium]|jgi:hypothetical protein
MSEAQSKKISSRQDKLPVQFNHIFDLNELQELQDLFSDATGVASIITTPDGIPVTKPSNFCKLCEKIIRNTEQGISNCIKSDAFIGSQNMKGPIVQNCMSAGLWDAGAGISVGGRHIANWLIGQVRSNNTDIEELLPYADEIGVDKEEYREALNEVPVMSEKKFKKIVNMLYAFANQLSEKAYSNLLLKNKIKEQELSSVLLKESEEKFQLLFNQAPLGYQSLDEKGHILEVNQQWLDTMGYQHQEVVGRWFGEFLSTEGQEVFRNRFPLFKETGHLRSEFEMIRKDGDMRFIAIDGKIGFNQNGTFKQAHCILKDITNQALAENALKEAKYRYDLAMMAANDGIYDWNLITDEIYYSPGWKKMLGYEDAEIENKFSVWESLTAPADVAKTMKLIRDMIDGKIQKFEVEFQMKHKDGHWVDILSRANKVVDPSGKTTRLVGTHMNITEHKKNREAIRHSEEKFRKIFNESPIGIEHYGADGFQLDANRASLQMFGIPDVSEIKSFNLFSGTSLSEETVETLKRGQSVHYQSSFDFDKVRSLNQYQTTREGSATFEYNITPLKNDGNHQVTGYLLHVQDITERKKAETEISMLAHSLESVNECVTITDLNNDILYVNRAFETTYGWRREEIKGKNITIVGGSNNKADYATEVLNHTINGGWIGEVVNKTRQGREFVVLLSTSFVKDSKGKTLGLIGVAKDITDQKLKEEELIRARQKAEESDRLKSAFLANMSHEIRTPMNGIMGFTNLLKEPLLTGEKQQKYIEIIERSGLRMLNIINDIISISKVEAGQMEVIRTDANVNDHLKFLHAFFNPEVEKKQLKFQYKIGLSENLAIVKTDHEKVLAILTNLIKNAIKFTSFGTIEFGYHRNSQMLEFYVEDTGTGIPEHKKEIIFERFRQGSESLSRQYEGAGLGLTISKAYTGMLGGSIWVESVGGKGSKFCFTIPYHPAMSDTFGQDERNSKIDVTRGPKKLKILVAEDDSISEQFFRAVLANIARELIIVKTGAEAVAACRENEDIDLVLMDIKMPVMDGYEASRQIRCFNKKIIIFAQTAYALVGDREKALANGCNDYISKPVDIHLLLKLIEKYNSVM